MRAPARTLTAVRAIAPVAGMPPNNGDTMFARPWPNELAVRVVPADVAHAVGDLGRQQALDRGQQRDRERRPGEARQITEVRPASVGVGKCRRQRTDRGDVPSRHQRDDRRDHHREQRRRQRAVHMRRERS